MGGGREGKQSAIASTHLAVGRNPFVDFPVGRILTDGLRKAKKLLEHR